MALLVAGGGFAAITVVVIIKGGGDLRAMLAGLKASAARPKPAVTPTGRPERPV